MQIAETFLRCVCERLRTVSDGFATYTMTCRGFCHDFCRTKKYYMFKTLANRSRRVRDACEDFAIHCTMRTFRDSSRRFGISIRKPIANSSHPSEIGAYDSMIDDIRLRICHVEPLCVEALFQFIRNIVF